jgi:hypothetical protein
MVTEVEEEMKAREGYDYGNMKGHEGWTTVGEESVEKVIPLEKRDTPNYKNAVAPKNPTQIMSPPMSQKTSQAQHVAMIRKAIQTEKEPCLTFLQKDKPETVSKISSMTIKVKLNDKGQAWPLDAMKKIIEEIVGIPPLNLSVITPTSMQILFKEEDLVSFRKLLNCNKIEIIEAKRENFHPRDINRLAHLYLSGYYKELAHAALQGLSTTTVAVILAKAAGLVKSRFPNLVTQKKWMYNIKKDTLEFQPAQEVMEVSSA